MKRIIMFESFWRRNNSILFWLWRNICSRERETNHRDHKIISIFQLNKETINYRNIIYEKNKNLSYIIKFNNLILNTFEKFKNNYFHIKNIINLGKSIEKENLRDSQDTVCMEYNLVNSLYKQRNSINILYEKFGIYLKK